jgi:hypothetical protein
VHTDVRLGGHTYHSADVTFIFHGDAQNIRGFSAADPNPNDFSVLGSVHGSGWCLDAGQASVEIATPSRSITANFTTGQILVASDTENGGIGFSSYTGPFGVEPAYPLGVLDGSVKFSGGVLNTTFNTTGKAWSCIGYPPLSLNNPNPNRCADPTKYPLKTDQGDFVIFQTFNDLNADGTLCCDFGGSFNRGTFSAMAQ